MNRLPLILTLLAALAAFDPTPAAAQPGDLLLPAQASSVAGRPGVPAQRARKARVHLPALQAESVRLTLFEDFQRTFARKSVDQPSAESMVWVGEDEMGGQAVLTVFRGVLTGTIFADHRTFEIVVDRDGQYDVAELDSTAFPTDDPEVEEFDPEPENDAAADARPARVALDSSTTSTSTTSTTTSTSTTGPVIVVMIMWTPKAESAGGGSSAMYSLALNAVANANLVYANSGVSARLALGYAGKISYTETVSGISTDLKYLKGTTDGKMDSVHTLRNQYRADIVSLLGEGYKAKGVCGIGSLMTTVSTSFASSAFNIVDRLCALSNLSYAHEVGHNEGLQHNPSNAGTAPSWPYAYGYQDPSGYFRTVLSYGSAKRIPHLSSPRIYYNSRVTGTSAQDNARALNASATTVAAFRGTSGTCTYSLSASALSFSSSGAYKTVSVTAPSGCTWTATESAGWLTLDRNTGAGSGQVKVSVSSNVGSGRSTTVSIAGKSISVSQAGQ